jgi:hypothetical protein
LEAADLGSFREKQRRRWLLRSPRVDSSRGEEEGNTTELMACSEGIRETASGGGR